MIFLHGILGLILSYYYGHFWAFMFGCCIADIDHIYTFRKIGIFTKKGYSWNKMIDAMKHEEKYGMKSKTKAVHSILGAGVFTLGVYLFFPSEALFFGIGYLTHLLLDWPDKDEKYLLYPIPWKMKGFLPIWSKQEKVVTVLGLLFIAGLYLL